MVMASSLNLDKTKALKYLAQWEELCQRDNGSLWGVNLRTPFVIVDQVTREITANEEGFGSRFPNDIVITATGFEYQSRWWAMAPWHIVETYSEKERMKLLVHEAFHTVQPSLFGREGENTGNNAHLEELDARVLFFVEMDALLEALKNKGDAQIKAAHAALQARGLRRKKYGPMTEATEEISEGTAVYTEIMIVDPDGYLEVMEQRTQLARGPALPMFMGYLAGAMYCFVLDKLGVDWKPGLKHNSDLGEILANAIGTADVDLNEYGYRKITKEEENNRATRERELNQIREAFTTRPLLKIFEEGQKAVAGIKFEITGFGTAARGVVQYIGDFGKMDANKDIDFAKILELKNDFLVHDNGYCAVFAEGIKIEGNKVTGDYWELVLNEGFVVVADGINFEVKIV
ncbi:MAG: hypothetical protein FWC73_02855 [Defluviitaleaceae bacterium]|nr:hypothetical protein [Defluviitaleaceae bacterium]